MRNKKFALSLFFFALSLCLNAKVYVYQLTGESFLVKGGTETNLYKTQTLKPTDLVRTADYASLTLLDDQQQKLFTVQSAEPLAVKEIVSRKEHNVSLLKEAFYGIFRSMHSDTQKSMAHYQQRAGVTYRGDDEDRAVAIALTAKGESIAHISNRQTDYPLTLRLLDLHTNQPVNVATVGSNLYAEVENRSNTALYVNLIDIDSDGSQTILFPMDELSSMLHLIVPAYSTIRFSDFPFTIYEPTGTDHLLLVAFAKPYNLQHVLELMPLEGTATQKVGIQNVPLQIKP